HLLEGRAGLQRRLARVRPRRRGAPTAHRFRAGPGTGSRKRPMIAVLLAQTIAITGGRVYPVSGPKISNATVLIRDGKIAAVGTGVAVPSDPTRIDAAASWVWWRSAPSRRRARQASRATPSPPRSTSQRGSTQRPRSLRSLGSRESPPCSPPRPATWSAGRRH